MPFKFNPFTDKLDLVGEEAPPGGFVATLTGDSGGAVGPDASQNINVLGHPDINIAGNSGTHTLQATNLTKNSPYVVGSSGQAAYTTIQSAINAAFAAGGGTVIIQKGTYTENLTLKIGVGLLAVEANVDNLNVNIIGTHTPDTANGIMSFRNINFFSTTSIFSSSAAGQGYLDFEQCNWILSSNGYIFDIPNWVGPTGLTPGSNGLAIIGCGDLSTAVSGFLRNSAGMDVSLINSYVGSYVGGGSSLPLQCSGKLALSISDVYCPIEISGSKFSFISDTGMHGVGLTVSGSTTGYVANTIFDQLTTAAFTMSSSGAWSISTTTINTTNNPAITGSGAGPLYVIGVSYLNSATISGTVALNTGILDGGIAYLKNLSFNRGATTVATNGQLIIGSTGLSPQINTLTAGTGISISNGAGSITINGTGGALTWTDVTGATQTVVASNGYLADRGGGVTFTLPASATIGDVFRIVGVQGSWTLAQNANQQIKYGSTATTVGAGGSLASTNAGDCVELVATNTSASTVWRVISSIGNITVV